MEHAVAFLQYVVSNLVDSPDQVHIEDKKDEQGILFTLSVAKEDMGKVIGKDGKTIYALRSLLKSIGMKHHEKFYLRIEEPGNDTDSVSE